MLVGEQWRPQLADAIERSRAALLLVSGAFLASDYIMEEELPALTERGVQLVPVLIRPCLWQSVATLEQVQWAHDPNRDGPVASAGDPEAQIVRVCQKLLAALPPDLEEPPPPSLAGNAVVVPRAAALRADERPGELDGVPPLPASYVAREEVAGLRDALLAAGDGAMGITGNAQALGLHGQGGIGKTVLAAALARDDAVRRHFPDGVFWVTVGESADLAGRRSTSWPGSGSAPGTAVGNARARSSARRWRTRSLLVIDDVWSTAAAAAFRPSGHRADPLHLTRSSGPSRGRYRCRPASRCSRPTPLGGCSPPVAMPVDALPPEADRILEATGRSALALAIVGAAIGRGGASWSRVVDQLDRGDPDVPRPSLCRRLQGDARGHGGARPPVADAYRASLSIPKTRSSRSPRWPGTGPSVGRLAGRDRAAARLLAGQKLLTVDPDGFSFHDLQREFLLLQAGELSLAHADLLAAYRVLLPLGADWSALPRDEPYIWDHLIYHLRGTGDAAGVVSAPRPRVPRRAQLPRRAIRGRERSPPAAAPTSTPRSTGCSGYSRNGATCLPQESPMDLAATITARSRTHPRRSRSAGLARPGFLAPRWGCPRSGAHSRTRGHIGRVHALAFAPTAAARHRRPRQSRDCGTPPPATPSPPSKATRSVRRSPRPPTASSSRAPERRDGPALGRRRAAHRHRRRPHRQGGGTRLRPRRPTLASAGHDSRCGSGTPRPASPPPRSRATPAGCALACARRTAARQRRLRRHGPALGRRPAPNHRNTTPARWRRWRSPPTANARQRRQRRHRATVGRRHRPAHATSKATPAR